MAAKTLEELTRRYRIAQMLDSRVYDWSAAGAALWDDIERRLRASVGESEGEE